MPITTAPYTLAEGITASFYAWEIRGRGWTVADYPVALEPPYRPFFLLPQCAPEHSGRIDDGRRPTILSRLVESVRGGSQRAPEPVEPFEEEAPYPERERSTGVAIRFALPENLAVDATLSSRLLLSLACAREPLAFEVVGHGGHVELQLYVAEPDVDHVLETLRAYLPDLHAMEGHDLVSSSWGDGTWHGILDFGLAEEFFLPLQIERRVPIDTYAPLIAAMAQCRPGESLILQVLFEPVRNPWARTIVEALDDGDGGSILEDAPDFPSLAAEKLRSPLLAAVVRFGVKAETEARMLVLARSIEGFIAQFARADGNSLVPLGNDGYEEEDHARGVFLRTTHRTGMILSTEEVAALVHIPDASLTHPALVRTGARSRPTPLVAKGHDLVLGENTHEGIVSAVTLPDEGRFAHTHVIGSTGTGKSTLLVHLITQDIARGDGVAVFDPHGDLVDDILVRIPEERRSDVILFDPSDEECPVGFGFFNARSDVERNLIASDTVAIFERLATSWGDSMSAVLGNTVYAMLASPTPATLLDLRRFLIDERFRMAFLARVSDPEVRLYWEAQFPIIGARSIGSILTRLDGFLRPRIVRNVVGQREPRLSISEVLGERKILLVRLPQGQIGAENAALLGSLLVTKIHQGVLARQRLPQSERVPFFCYLDEFQHFVTPSIASLVSEGRKYRIGLTVAHQSLAQLTVSAVESAVLSNMYTRIVFRTGDADAKRLAEGFAHFAMDDVQALVLGEAIVRIGSARDDCMVSTFPPSKPLGGAELIESIRAESRARYGISRDVLDAEGAQEAARWQSTMPESPTRPEPALAEVPRTKPVGNERAAESGASPAMPPPVRPRPQGVPAELGKGGQEHKYLQQLVKRLGEERGFRAVIEEDIGEGRNVDVLLRREGFTVACEISVTTEIDHELANIVKCAASGYSQILFITASKRKRDQIAKRASEAVPGAPLIAISPEEIVAALESFEVPETTAESTVRGYKVKVKRQSVSPQDVASRRSAVAEVIARSLAKDARK